MPLLGIWLVVAVGCALTRLIVRRLDDAERARSREQWRLMCDVLRLEDFTGERDGKSGPGRTSPSNPEPAVSRPCYRPSAMSERYSTASPENGPVND